MLNHVIEFEGHVQDSYDEFQTCVSFRKSSFQE